MFALCGDSMFLAAANANVPIFYVCKFQFFCPKINFFSICDRYFAEWHLRNIKIKIKVFPRPAARKMGAGQLKVKFSYSFLYVT
jgi:hypothetical protein